MEYIQDKKRYFLQMTHEKKDKDVALQNISYKLEEFTDLDEANKFLTSCNELSQKSDLLKLAKLLNVYIEKDGNNDEIVKKIVDAVVGSKLRSLTLRGKTISKDRD